MVGEDSSFPSAFPSQQSINQVLPVLHLGWNTPLKVSSGCAGPPSPIAQVGITDNLPLYLCRRHHKELPYLLDQTPLSNCRHTLGRAKWNSRRSRIPYSAKFSRRIIFAVFADSSRTAKIKLLETFRLMVRRGKREFLIREIYFRENL